MYIHLSVLGCLRYSRHAASRIRDMDYCLFLLSLGEVDGLDAYVTGDNIYY